MPKPELSLFSVDVPRHANTLPSGPDRRRQRQERELDRVAGTSAAKTVSISLSSLIPLLIDAVDNDRAWLRDFADEAVRIDADLYDVLLAYQQLRRPAAA